MTYLLFQCDAVGCIAFLLVYDFGVDMCYGDILCIGQKNPPGISVREVMPGGYDMGRLVLARGVYLTITRRGVWDWSVVMR